MRWSIVGLLALGLLAAVCSAVLMAMFRAGVKAPVVLGPTTKPAETVQVVVAARDFKPMSVIDGHSLQCREMPRSEAPAGHISSPMRLIGKVMAVSMMEGQPVLESCLATDGTGAQLAAALPEGKRAVSIPIPDRSGLENLLYPGCLVDVMASFRISPEKENAGGSTAEAISTVLMQGIQVLAVGDRSVVSSGPDTKVGEAVRPRSARCQTASLLVDPVQAEALQLAMEHGTLSLALRNPMYDAPKSIKGTFLSQLSEEFASMMRSEKRKGGSSEPAAEKPAKDPQTQPYKEAAPPAPKEDVEGPLKPKWITTVIRGPRVATTVFGMEEVKENKVDMQRKD